MQEQHYYVYLLASRRNGTLYCGMTNNLARRVFEHKEGAADGISKQHNIKTLVWFELHGNVEAAITREKQIKKWNRAWKLNMIEEQNPNWNDLFETLI